MGIFDVFKKKPAEAVEPPIPADEKSYYRPDSYYTAFAHEGTQFQRKVITFEERKKISYPSSRGLYVAEILLLEYCSYGTYPKPKTGYPGFWWFAYGIRNVGYHLKRLEDLGYIELLPQKGKYYLTELGQLELGDNLYVPFMHKHKKKTTEDTRWGPMFNVWSVNREIHARPEVDWRFIVQEQEATYDAYHEKKQNEHLEALKVEDPEMYKKEIDSSTQLEAILAAEEKYKADINSLIIFWEEIWQSGGLKFNGSKWTFRLPDLYIKVKRYDDALKILGKINNSNYKEKKASYIEKVNSLKAKK